MDVGDIVRMTSFSHTQHDDKGKMSLQVSFRTKDRSNVSLFLLLGEERKDGSDPLDLLAVMDKMGWKPKNKQFAKLLANR